MLLFLSHQSLNQQEQHLTHRRSQKTSGNIFTFGKGLNPRGHMNECKYMCTHLALFRQMETSLRFMKNYVCLFFLHVQTVVEKSLGNGASNASTEVSMFNQTQMVLQMSIITLLLIPFFKKIYFQHLRLWTNTLLLTSSCISFVKLYRVTVSALALSLQSLC